MILLERKPQKEQVMRVAVMCCTSLPRGASSIRQTHQSLRNSLNQLRVRILSEAPAPCSMKNGVWSGHKNTNQILKRSI